MLQIRAFDNPDWAQIWPILRDMVVEQLSADLGFVTIGTVPGAFNSPTKGRVGLHVLYRPLP